MKILKKKISAFIFSITAVIMCLFCFAGCSKGFSGQGSFSEEQLVLSIGDTFAPSDYFTGNQNISFTSSDKKILSLSESGEFVASSSGSATVLAKAGGILVDQMQVYVKHIFSAPINLKVSNDGLLTWDDGTIFLDGELVRPTYIVKITQGESESFATCNTNAYQFVESGEYEVSVRCQASDMVDGSKYSEALSFKFDLLAGARDFKFLSEQVFGSQKGIFTWTGNGEASLEIGGIKSEHSQNFAQRDFSGYSEGSEITASLVLNDERFGSSKTKEIKVFKLETPIAHMQENKLVWEDSQASELLFRAELANSDEYKIIKVRGQSTELEGLGEGVYNLTYQAMGGEGLANGNVKYFSSTIGKIGNVDAECQRVGNKLKVTFSTASQYSRRFVVRQNGKEREFSFNGEPQNGKYTLTEEFELSTGENIFSVQALPTLDNGFFECGGKVASNVLMSDEEVFMTAYVIDEFPVVAHSLNEGESELVFDNIAFANDFEVKVNGVQAAKLDFQIGESQTRINIGKISQSLYGAGNEFNVSIVASRKPSEGEITYERTTSKKLTMLDTPSGLSLAGGKLETNRYSWDEMANAKFEYVLTNMNTGFDGELSSEKFETTENRTCQLKAGYYSISVRALPLDENLFLPSENAFEDNFFFAESILAPGLRLDFDESVATLAEKSGYVLTIKTSEFGYKYEVFVDDVLAGSVFNENGVQDTLTFNFDKATNFAQAGKEYKIKVRVSAKTADEQAIHMTAEAVLTAEKLAAPTASIVGQNEVFTVGNTDSRAELEIFKEGKLLAKGEAGKSASASVAEFDGEFDLKVRAVGYDLFDEFSTDGKTFLSSELAVFAFHRSQTPSELNYKNESISFVHDDECDVYVCTIEVASNNGRAVRTFEASSTTFNLEDRIAELRRTDEEFDSYFTQKTSITISLYAKISKQIDGVYYLSSRDATCLYNENSTLLNISKLDEVKLDYDEKENKLVWQPIVADGAVYDVYLGNNKQISLSETAPSGRYEFSLDKYDFTSASVFEFHVVVHSDNSLRSEPSKKIILHKITAPKGLSIYRQGDKYMASFKLENNEENYISEILVNGESIGEARVFELKSDTTNIVVKGTSFQEDGDKTFYISSSPADFEIRKLVKGEFAANTQIVAGEIVWEDYLAANASDWSLTTPHENIAYEIEVFDGADRLVKTISSIEETKLSLNSRELAQLAANGYHISLYAYVSEHEILNGGKGYYGRVLLEEGIALRKLEAVKNLTLSVDSQEAGVDGELEKDIMLSWQFDGASSAEVQFEIFVSGRKVAETNSMQFALSQAELNQGENKISVVACNLIDVRSDETSLTINVFEKPQISLSDLGVLQISAGANPPATNGFIVELVIDGNAQNIYTTASSLDLQRYIAGASGDYTIRVLHRLTQTSHSAAMPNKVVATLNGNILPQPIVTQDATGASVSSSMDGVRFFVRCDALDFEQEIKNNHFNFPDAWESGRYELVFYVVKEGSVHSWTGESAVKSMVIDRVANARELTFERFENYLDSTISWPKIDNAAGYEIEIYSGDKLVATTGKIENNSILKSELFERVGGLSAGGYTFSFRTLADFDGRGQTISQPLVFDVTVRESTVSNISASAKGEVHFSASSTAAGFRVVAESLAGAGETQIIALSSTERDAIISKLTGQLKVSVAELASLDNIQTSASRVMLDPESKSMIFYKLQNIVSIVADAAEGNLIFTAENDGVTGSREFYAKATINGVTHERALAVNKTSETTFQTSALKLAESFPIAEEGMFNFSIYSVIQGSLRSDEKEFGFEFKFNNGTVTRDKASELEDYMLIKETKTSAGQMNGLTKIFMRSSVLNMNKWDEHIVDKDAVKGWWLTRTFEEDGIIKTQKYFSKNKIEEEGYSCEEAYGIDITELSTNMNIGSREFQIAYITSTAEHAFTVNFYSERFIYEKMAGPTGVALDSGNIKWTNSTAANSGFMLYFENKEGTDIVKINSTDASYYLGEDVKKLGTFTVAVRAVSNVIGRLPSNKIYFTQSNKAAEVTKLGPVANDMRVENGVLKLEFNDLRERNTEEEKRRIDSVEGLIANKTVTTIVETIDIYARALISRVFTHPFNYTLESLGNLRFNLMFTNKLDGKIYLTSVEADKLLSRLSEETLAEIFDASENDRILESLRKQLRIIYSHLTDKTLFGGVATSSHLFDEIGVIERGVYNKYPARNIPAGTYDIAIQQAGSASDKTLSSAYQTKLENIILSAAPQTLADSEPNDSSSGVANNYYIKFLPIDGKNDYVLVLKNKNDSTQVIEYDITFENEKWTRKSYASSTSAGRVELSEDSENFVRIALNGDGGLIYESAVRDIYGRSVEIYGQDFTAHIYVKGSDVELNGKSETISITFLKFNISTFAVKDGSFSWDNFSVNGQNYVSSVIYKQKNISAERSARVPGRYATFTPTEAGEYEYIKFLTQGSFSKFSVVVDSPIYTIENVCKLSAPNVGVKNGRLAIEDNAANRGLDPRENKEFVLSNNRGTSKAFAAEKTADGRYVLNRQTGANKDLEDEFGSSERDATIFYAYVNGDDVSASDISAEGSDLEGFNLTISGLNRNLLLRSESGQVNANKLKLLSDAVKVDENGNIKWQQSNGGVDGYTLADGLTIVYEVEIEYYFERSTGWEINAQHTKHLFTTSTTLNASEIVDPILSLEARYKIYIRPNVYTRSNVGDVETIEGETFVLVDGARYTNGAYVLDGELRGTGIDLIERTQAVSGFAIISDGFNEQRTELRDGVFTWKYPYAEDKYTGDVAFVITAIAPNSQRIVLDGEVIMGEIDDAGLRTFTFEISPEAALSPELGYNFEIIAIERNAELSQDGQTGENVYVYTGKKITSRVSELAAKNARILPEVGSSDYSTDREENSVHTIDFTRYFSSLSVPASNVAIEVSYKDARYSQEQHRFITVADKILRIKIVEQLGGEEADENTIVFKDGDKIELKLTPKPFKKNDTLKSNKSTVVNLESVSWTENDLYYFDNEKQIFYWTFGVKYADKTSANAQIFVKDEEGGITALGVKQGDSVSGIQNISANNKIAIWHENRNLPRQIRYVEAQPVLIENGKAYVSVESLTANIYNRAEDTQAVATISTADGEFELAFDGWAVKTNFAFDNGERICYLPKDAISKLSQSAYTAARDAAYYVDEACMQPIYVPLNTSLKVKNFNAALAEQEVEYNNGTIIYIKTTDILHYLTQDEEHFRDIEFNKLRFKVSFTTSFPHTQGATTYTTTAQRQHDNIPFGQLQYGSFNGIPVDERGIYVTSFEPTMTGTISNFSVQVRKSDNNLLSASLANYAGAARREFEFNLFEKGSGDATGLYGMGPYQISNQEQLQNISYRSMKKDYHLSYKEKVVIRWKQGNGAGYVRNDTSFKEVVESDKVFYFSQTADLDVVVSGGFFIKSPFVGNYNGQNYRMKVTIASIDNLTSPIQSRVATAVGEGSSSVEFTRGAALFREIGKGGKVSNLNVDFNLALSQDMSGKIGTSDALVGGLVLENNGEVSALTVNSSSVVFNYRILAGGKLAVSPLIGENKSLASGLKSNANVKITNSFTAGAQNFYYGGLIGFNDSVAAKVQGAENNEAIDISFTSNRNGTVMAGGVMISAFNSSVEMALNRAGVKAVSSNGTAFAAGCIVHAYASSVYSSVNTGDIVATNAGGIMFNMLGAQIGTLVGMGKVNGRIDSLLAKSGTVNSAGKCYVYGSYNPPSTITTNYERITSNKTITCKDNVHKIEITYASQNDYSVKIV